MSKVKLVKIKNTSDGDLCFGDSTIKPQNTGMASPAEMTAAEGKFEVVAEAEAKKTAK